MKSVQETIRIVLGHCQTSQPNSVNTFDVKKGAKP